MNGRFYRSRKYRVIGGVAGGLAEYWHLDPVVARVLFIIVALMTGVGVLLYIILWIIIPEEPLTMPNFGKEEFGEKTGSEKKEDENTNSFSSSTENKYQYDYDYYKKTSSGGRTVGGIILICLGLFFLAERIFPYFDFEDFLPLILIGIGLILILKSNRKQKNAI
ncbi:MAG: PspC domain-containing protein [Melioribacteraceae bacterium]|nr:MAG: PspC domain-containing protein [Melioribacteraceae bacterium]